jgi:hypothetical protein
MYLTTNASSAAIDRAASAWLDRQTDDHQRSVDRLSDEDIEELNDVVDAESLEDVRHDMRVVWREAIDTLGGLNPQRLPVVENGKLSFRSLPVVLAAAREHSNVYVLLAEILRGASPEALHLHLRTAWIDANAQALAEVGWTALTNDRYPLAAPSRVEVESAPLESGDNAGVPSFTEVTSRVVRHD